MNGMAAKRDRKERERRFTTDGLLRDAREWTEADWKDVFETIQALRHRIAERHKGERDAND